MWLEIVTDFGGEFSFPLLPLDGAGDVFFCLLFFPPLPPPDFGAFLLLSNFGEFSLLELFCCLPSDLFDLLLFSCLTSFLGDFLQTGILYKIEFTRMTTFLLLLA